ncbi:MAG: S41 family peptidase [Muribaculaceae bacterium]|nr:S41 family peptidase [Muribaculaceae bacterium]
MKNNKLILASIPLVLAIGVVGGIFLGKVFYNGQLSPQEEKMRTIMALIENEYVDDVSLDSIMEGTFSGLLSQLDPHSVYIPAEDLAAVTDELEGSFSGVGVSFQIISDTVNIIEIVPGGPAESVGLQPGDKILKANDVDLTGAAATTENVYRNLRGEKGSKVTLTIKRRNAKAPIAVAVTRGDVPQTSVDAKYMLSDEIGYVKVSKFARNTYQEFMNALQHLEAKGAKKFVIDLRGNSGGYLEQAVMMINEFLPPDRMIVYTKGKNPVNESYAISNGRGHYLNSEIVVMTDEFSASASEIFAGAIQDNDRGLVIGRRTFGKGLVQNQLPLNDSSAIRLTVARYYTPSGRSIQKEYKLGEGGKYDLDLSQRFAHGEFYSADSIKLDKTKEYSTTTGRPVYGGGGIMPDFFVPEDSTGITNYYISVSNGGMLRDYAYKMADQLRGKIPSNATKAQYLKALPSDEVLLQGFVDYAVTKGVPARWYYIRQSEDLILQQLKAVIARDVVGYNLFVELLNDNDNTVSRAVGALKNGESPVVIRPEK